MPDLSHLRIGKVPSAFAEMAEKHNELVQLIASIEAASGINIKMVSSPEKKLKVPGTSTTISRKPRGRIRIGIQPAANGQNLTTQLNELHFRYYSDPNNPNSTLLRAYDVDNTNGAVWTDVPNAINVGIANNGAIFSYDTPYVNQMITPNGYTGHMYNPSTSIETSYVLDETGLLLLDTANNDFFKVVRTSSTTQIQLFNITGSRLLNIDAKNVTRNMGIKTINVCSGNVTMSMLIIASDPF
jgi:hypothetical protein